MQGQRIQKASSVKYTAPLLDTPQTINVIGKETMQEQNLLSLQDILSTLPGITFGAGEGGGGFGDKINLRGFSGDSDITVDGVRDSGLYSRTDPFNLDSVEVTNGANSVYSGAGSVGGSVNLVSKTARADEFHNASIAAGTDSYTRVTADSNFGLGEGAALRLNLMAHQNDVPGRDVEQMQRWGFAPSIAFGLGTDTAWTLSYLHQEDENTPQYGVPYINGTTVPGVDPENYYGYRNVDRQDTQADMFTSEIKHAFSDNFSLRNLTRYADVGSLTVVDAPSGTWCLANGTNAATGANCTTGPAAMAPGTYQPAGNRGTTRDTRNTVLHTQFDALAGFNTGAIEHDLVAGASFTQEDFDLAQGNSLRNPDGSVVPLPPMSIANPDSFYTGPINFIVASRQQGELDNRALYVFDTLKFNEQWQLNAGVRYEHNEGSHRTDTGRHARRRRRSHAGADLHQRRRSVLVPRRAGVQAGRERQHLPRLRQRQDAVEGLGQRILHRADLHGGSRVRREHRAGHQVGHPRRAPVADRRAVAQRAQQLQGGRPGQSRQPVGPAAA